MATKLGILEKSIMHHSICVRKKKISRDDGTAYVSADVSYTGEICPFCGSDNYYSGGSWSPGGCKDCRAIYHNGWVKEIEPTQSQSMLSRIMAYWRDV